MASTQSSPSAARICSTQAADVKNLSDRGLASCNGSDEAVRYRILLAEVAGLVDEAKRRVVNTSTSSELGKELRLQLADYCYARKLRVTSASKSKDITDAEMRRICEEYGCEPRHDEPKKWVKRRRGKGEAGNVQALTIKRRFDYYNPRFYLRFEKDGNSWRPVLGKNEEKKWRREKQDKTLKETAEEGKAFLLFAYCQQENLKVLPEDRVSDRIVNDLSNASMLQVIKNYGTERIGSNNVDVSALPPPELSRYFRDTNPHFFIFFYRMESHSGSGTSLDASNKRKLHDSTHKAIKEWAPLLGPDMERKRRDLERLREAKLPLVENELGTRKAHMVENCNEKHSTDQVEKWY